MKYGFSSQDNFTTSFRSYFGVTPKEIYNLDRKYKRFISKLREVYSIMEIAGLKQPPFNTTLMGCITSASDYFDIDLTPAMLYGLTGHAFLINIHEALCPSGPYVWKYDGFIPLLRNVGIEWVASYHYGKDSSEEERKKAEQHLVNVLNEGGLGILSFMENQLVSGYDETGFHFLLPWGMAGSELKHLTFTSWDECFQHAGWGGFSIIKKGTLRSDIIEMTREALAYALELYRRPEHYEDDNGIYRIGYGAYENWIAAVKNGHGAEHGNWWNGMVWTECRKMGARFFEELGEVLDNESARSGAETLAATYSRIADNLDRIKEKDLESDSKIELLSNSASLEHEAEQQIEQLLRTTA